MAEADGGGAEFTVVLPDALAEPQPALTASTSRQPATEEES